MTYTLPSASRPQVDFNRLIILYGDNGSGKTTLLTLLFCLLSPVRERGEKTYVARTPFKRFEVEFDDGTIVSATKDTDRLVGSYTVTINQSGNDQEAFYLKADADNAITAPPDEQASKLLQRLAKLGIALYFLPDDRRARTTFSSDTDSDDSSPRFIRSVSYRRVIDDIDTDTDAGSRWLEISDSTRESHHLDIAPVLENVGHWFRSHAFQGSSAGEETATSIYLRVVEQIRMLAGAATVTDANYEGELIKRLRTLEGRMDAFTRFGLITPFPAEKFLDVFIKASDPARRTIATVIEPYLDGIEARLNALDTIRTIIRTYVETINEFLTAKSLEFSLQMGATIRGYRTVPLDPNRLSSGEKQLFLLLSNTILARDAAGIFLIDEPELSLNVKWQRGLIDALLRCSEGSSIQYFLASHSLELITQHKQNAVQLVA